MSLFKPVLLCPLVIIYVTCLYLCVLLAIVRAVLLLLFAAVEDRMFNDLRYTINSDKIIDLGWREVMPWEEGLARTVDWYRKYSQRYAANIENALVAHPRAGAELGTN